jgi:hypothetical protein
MHKKHVAKRYPLIFLIVLVILVIISAFITLKYSDLIRVRLTSPGYPDVNLPDNTQPMITTGPCRGQMNKCEYYHDSFTCQDVCGCEWNQWMVCAIPSNGRSKTCADLQNSNDCSGCGCTWVGETTNQENINEKKIICKEDNPTATDEYCNDVAYHDIAIINKDIVLCEKIINGWLKEHCIRSLR